MPLPPPKFEDGKVWDGTTPHARPSKDVYKGPDGEIGNRHSAEIIALEELLNDVIEILTLLENPGAANSVLGVKNDQSTLEYKTLVEGSGVTITHGTETITIASSAGAPEVDIADLTNNNANPIVIGTPVYCESAGKVDLAKADASATVQAIGLVKDVSIAASAGGDIQTDGVLVATTAQWDAVAGTTGGLTPGSVYFLSATTAGKLTETAPTTIGHYVVRVGVALDTTEMEITFSQPILL